MTVWRMAFRVGTGGEEMWLPCKRSGVAAITYPPIYDIDLSKCPRYEPKKQWAQLSAPQKYSLRQVAYEMKKGDVIYAKQGSMIVGKGIVKGSYRFERKKRIQIGKDIPWMHRVPVKWLSDFVPVEVSLGDQQRWTVRKLSAGDVRKVEREEQRTRSRVAWWVYKCNSREPDYARASGDWQKFFDGKHGEC
jgi:hypothetical protein